MVIVDPKGELVRKSGRFLERKGYQKVVLDWRNRRSLQIDGIRLSVFRRRISVEKERRPKTI